MNEDEWDEILHRFREESLDPELPDDRKVLYVWRWLVDAETNCISLRHQLDKVSRRQADELEDIRNCMEQMCNAWEVKVSKLEEENKQFQDQLNFSGQGSGRIVSQSINQMIMREGLSDILQLGVVEQFSYLLDLRTRLQARLDQETAMRRKCEQLIRMSSNLPDCLKLSSPYIQRILDRQKEEYEEEMRHQQETMKQVKEQLKQVHEDELQRLTSHNETLNSELTQLSQKLQELVTHLAKQQEKDTTSLPWVQHILNGNHENDMRHLKEEVDRLKNICQEQQKQIREQNEGLRILERTNKQLELDNETLAFKLSESLSQFDELEDQLRRESTRVRREPIYKQMSNAKESLAVKNNINKLLDNRQNSQDGSLEEQVQQLKAEATSLKEQLETVQQQLDVMNMKYQQHKERYREKMFRLRDLQDQEQREWKERLENCEKESSILRDMLAREQEWRRQVEADCRKLKNDNQLLKSSMSIGEKNACETTLDTAIVQSEEEKSSKSSTARPLTASPSRRHSVWPILSYPKKW